MPVRGTDTDGAAKVIMTDDDGNEHDVGRLIGFTDAVAAIAITLIVLPLVDSARSSTTQSAGSFLENHASNLWAAGLSFLVIAAFWKDHHRLYRHVTGSSAALVNANLVWVAGISFLPLPTVLVVGSPAHDRIAAGLYIGTILVTQLAIRLQEVVVVRTGLLPSRFQPLKDYLWAEWITVGLTVAALIVAVAVPAAGLYPLTVLLLSRPINWLVQRKAPREARSRRIL